MKFCIYKDAKGEWRWYLRVANGNKIASSGEGYVNRRDCETAIDRVKSSTDAPVVDC